MRATPSSSLRLWYMARFHGKQTSDAKPLFTNSHLTAQVGLQTILIRLTSHTTQISPIGNLHCLRPLTPDTWGEDQNRPLDPSLKQDLRTYPSTEPASASFKQTPSPIKINRNTASKEQSFNLSDPPSIAQFQQKVLSRSAIISFTNGAIVSAADSIFILERPKYDHNS